MYININVNVNVNINIIQGGGAGIARGYISSGERRCKVIAGNGSAAQNYKTHRKINASAWHTWGPMYLSMAMNMRNLCNLVRYNKPMLNLWNNKIGICSKIYFSKASYGVYFVSFRHIHLYLWALTTWICQTWGTVESGVFQRHAELSPGQTWQHPTW